MHSKPKNANYNNKYSNLEQIAIRDEKRFGKKDVYKLFPSFDCCDKNLRISTAFSKSEKILHSNNNNEKNSISVQSAINYLPFSYSTKIDKPLITYKELSFDKSYIGKYNSHSKITFLRKNKRNSNETSKKFNKYNFS